MCCREPKDVVAIERTREFRGRYHVLGGSINPIEALARDLRIRELLSRLADSTINEVILATDPNLEEKQPLRISRTIQPLGIAVVGDGLPVGGDLEYADENSRACQDDGTSILPADRPGCWMLDDLFAHALTAVIVLGLAAFMKQRGWGIALPLIALRVVVGRAVRTCRPRAR